MDRPFQTFKCLWTHFINWVCEETTVLTLCQRRPCVVLQRDLLKLNRKYKLAILFWLINQQIIAVLFACNTGVNQGKNQGKWWWWTSRGGGVCLMSWDKNSHSYARWLLCQSKKKKKQSSQISNDKRVTLKWLNFWLFAWQTCQALLWSRRS